MASNLDIALSGNDLVIIAGDFAIANTSDVQHIEDTINAFPGWWKNYPSEGVGIFKYVNGSFSEQEIKRSLMIQLGSDGYTVNNPQVTNDGNGNLIINPNASI